MGIAEHAHHDLPLPEQHLLRGTDRLQDYAGAFLRGEITAAQYSDLALAEITRRAPLDPVEPLVEPEPEPAPAPVALVDGDRDRSLVLARAFVGGRISAPDYLRLVRDC